LQEILLLSVVTPACGRLYLSLRTNNQIDDATQNVFMHT